MLGGDAGGVCGVGFGVQVVLLVLLGCIEWCSVLSVRDGAGDVAAVDVR